MKLKSTLLMLVLLVALAGYFFYYEQPLQENKEIERVNTEKIFAFEPDSVSSFTFTVEKDIVEFNRIDGTNEFGIVAPVKAKTEPGVVDKLFSGLNEIRYVTELEVEEGEVLDLKNYRLALPHFTVTLKFDDDSQKVFKFGSYNMEKNMIYAKRDGDDKVYLLRESAIDVIELSLNSFRDKRVVIDDLSTAAELNIARGDNELLLSKNADDIWGIIKPARIEADTADVKAYLNNLKNLKAIMFSNNLEKISDDIDFTKPDLSVVVSSADGKVLASIVLLANGPQVDKKLVIGGKAKESAHSRGGMGGDDSKISTSFLKNGEGDIFLVSYDDFKYINKSLLDMRQKSIFSYDMGDISKIQVIRDNRQLELSRDNTGSWVNSTTKDSPMRFGTDKVGTIFNYLNYVEAKEFYDKANFDDVLFGFANPTLQINFFGKDGKVIEQFITGKVFDKYTFLRRFNDGTVYMIDKGFIDRFILQE